jgi:hypothetical protein
MKGEDNEQDHGHRGRPEAAGHPDDA